ncbi:MAG: DUF1631 domain-containing protein [Gammaproteobacteria bacterium]|nr:MAG: DUF1631 domain-containing protein [Gammaproteobacteria bacterium]
MATEKVVQLDAVRQSSGRNTGMKIPLPLILLRDKLSETLAHLTQTLLDKADDALFELADKAATNADQTRYFDAMRIVRLNRDALRTRFLKGFSDAFRFEQGRRAESSLKDASFDPETLTLVENDALEQRVAVDSMASRIRSDAGQALEHLQMRVASLVPDADVDDDTLPMGPKVLSQAFADAMDGMELDLRVQLVLLKLFERLVLKPFIESYKEANSFLIAQGVMPDLRTARPASRSGGAVRPPLASQVQRTYDQATGSVEETGGEDTFALLRSLMAHADDESGRASGGAAAGIIAPRTVIAALTNFQARPVPVAQAETGLLDYQALVQQMVQQVSQGKGRLGQVDEDVINLVSMLFEYILSDKQLEPAIKAQIARLQIPVLKAALLDRSFFSRHNHSARRLLNELATSAIGWQPKENGQRDPYYETVSALVDRLVNEFDRDFSLFDEVLESFQAFLEAEEKRRKLLEKRTCDAEQGRAKAEIARERVREAIASRTGDAVIPEAIEALLFEGWSNWAVLVWLKHGPESKAFSQAMQVVEDVVWSLAPPVDDEGSRRKLLTMIPGMIKSLREGLASVAVDPGQQDTWLKALEKAHLKALHQLAAAGRRPVARDSVEATSQTDRESRTDTASQAAAPVHPETLPSEQAEEQEESVRQASETETDTEAAMEAAAEEIVLTAPDERGGGVYSGEDDSFLKEVDALKVGSWIELRQSENNKQRCKLAAIIPQADKYIFVNRMGVKVCEKTRMGIAVAMRAGQIRILDDGMLFDRALEAVIGSLRANQKAG